MKAFIFEIQRFTVNDGPGIRTTVFFKGCPLHCIWCHNPESITRKYDYMYFANKCTGCQACAGVCKQKVHSFAENVHRIDYDNCIYCGKCLEVCCYDALSIVGKEYTVDELLAQIEIDKAYYKDTGGVTLSGGEPMLQAEFVIELAKRLKEQRVHICMETSGFAKMALFQKVAPYIDVFLFDYKATPAEEHKKLTGVSSTLILKNLHYLNSIGKKIILRCPMIPGINDGDEHLLAISNLAGGYRMIQDVEVLPYHSLGESKCVQMGKKKKMNDQKPVTAGQKEEWMNKLQALGCHARIL